MPNYVIFSLSHAVAHVTLSPVTIAVPESAGMVTIEVIRSGDITGPSRVYFNTRPTATTPATATSKWLTTDQSQMEAKYLHIYDLITRYIQGVFLDAIIASVYSSSSPIPRLSPPPTKYNYFSSGKGEPLRM